MAVNPLHNRATPAAATETAIESTNNAAGAGVGAGAGAEAPAQTEEYADYGEYDGEYAEEDYEYEGYEVSQPVQNQHQHHHHHHGYTHRT
jgi:hypothetical protein